MTRYLWMLAAVYFIATAAHFGHNAEYIAFYPGMPAWLTREKVYVAWLGVTSIGLVALVLFGVGVRAIGLAMLGAYGACGLDGLLHYTLGLCSEHTLLANVTIWSEAVTGVLLLICSVLVLARRVDHGFPIARARARRE